MKNDWQLKKLGKICDVLDSKRKPVTQRDRVSGEYPYYGATGIQDYVNDYIFDEKLILIGEDGAKWGVGENTAFIADGKYWVNNHAHVIRPHRDTVLDNWIVYFLNVNDLSKYITGLTVHKLNQAKMREIEIPLPELGEQKRIVKKLDEIFEKATKAKEATEKNLQNAKELFESYLNGVFANPGKDWEEKRFEDVCELIGGSQPPKYNFIYQPKEGYVRLIQVRDYRTDKFATYIPEDKARRFCKKDDILIGRYGPPIFGIFRGIEGAYNVALMKAVPNKKFCNEDYFYWFLKNKNLHDFVEKSSKRAAGQDGVRKELIADYPVFIPPLNKQKEIVRKIKSLLIETERLEKIYEQKIADLEELKKSILNQAFTGKL